MRPSVRLLIGIISVASLLVAQLTLSACAVETGSADTAPGQQENVAGGQPQAGSDQTDEGDAGSLTGTILFNRIDYRSRQARHSLWGIDAAGGEPWEIPYNLQVDQSFTMLQISPDCQRLMYGVTDAHQKIRDIVVMDMDGGNPRHLALPGPGEVSAMEWSPDSGRIAVSMYVSEWVPCAEPSSQINNKHASIYILDLGGAVFSSFPVQFNPDMGELLWSRDGKKFAFFTDTSSRTDGIYVVDADGKNLMNVTQNVTIGDLGANSSGAASPADFEQMVEQREKMMEEGKLIESPSKPRWSPDSQKLAYFAQGAGTAELRTVDINTLEHRVLWSSEAPVAMVPMANIAWSPDGRTLAFSASMNLNRSDPTSMMKQSVLLINSDGSNLRVLLEGDESNELAGWRDFPVALESIG